MKKPDTPTGPPVDARTAGRPGPPQGERRDGGDSETPGFPAAGQQHSPEPHPAAEPGLRLSRRWRWALYGVSLLVLVLVFQAHRTPEVAVMWDTFLTLCGIR